MKSWLSEDFDWNVQERDQLLNELTTLFMMPRAAKMQPVTWMELTPSEKVLVWSQVVKNIFVKKNTNKERRLKFIYNMMGMDVINHLNTLTFTEFHDLRNRCAMMNS